MFVVITTHGKVMFSQVSVCLPTGRRVPSPRIFPWFLVPGLFLGRGTPVSGSFPCLWAQVLSQWVSQAVCLLRSRRRTFLFQLCFSQYFAHKTFLDSWQVKCNKKFYLQLNETDTLIAKWITLKQETVSDINTIDTTEDSIDWWRI